MQPKYKIIFLGTPEFAVPSIKALCEHAMRPVLIVSQPDRPQGRKKTIIPTPVHQFALEQNIPCYQPTKVRNQEFYNTLAKYEPDFLITAAYGRILTPEVLDLAGVEALNIHASLLPKYRGASPVQHALINGDQETGVSIMRMVEDMDRGPIFHQKSYTIPDGMKSDALMQALSYVAADILPDTLDYIYAGELEALPQVEEHATYVSLLDKNSGAINWNASAQELENLVRGTYPWPAAFASYQDKRIKILTAQAYSETIYSYLGLQDRKLIGQLISIQDKRLWIQTKNGVLAIDEIQLAGSRSMSTIECAHNFRIGEIWDNGKVT